MDRLPPLATMTVGSAATPGWLFGFRAQIRAGDAGPDDIAEAFDDATRLAIQDQIQAGIDVIADGELRRLRFVYEMYDRLTGLQRVPPGRRMGVPGYDRAPHFVADGRIAAPDGLGVVAELRRLMALVPDRPVKVALPGPLTFANNIEGAGVLDQVTAIVADEVRALAEVGADVIQLDEPGLTHPPAGGWPDDGVAAINAALAPAGDAGAVHVCFGNNASRPMARRQLAPLLPAMARLDCRLLLIEFANREMAEIETLAALPAHMRLAVGVVDVKSFYIESAEDVAARLRLALKHCPAQRLVATMDCGLSAIPRWLAVRKMQALVAGARLVR
jgi:5-methyltetrahydropteroyltriglutamate--homocysteine methyltransferase